MTAPPATFVTLSPGSPLAGEHREHVLDGILESGGPLVDWLLGGSGRSRPIVGSWMERVNSEVFIGRVTLGFVDGYPVGGFVSVPGGELAACRIADALAVLGATDRVGRHAARDRLEAGRRLFPPVESDELYLSKVWAPPSVKGFGHGLALLRHFAALGSQAGFSRLRADVQTTNTALQRFGEFLGWQVGEPATSPLTDMSYVAMTWDGPRTRRRRRS